MFVRNGGTHDGRVYSPVDGGGAGGGATGDAGGGGGTPDPAAGSPWHTGKVDAETLGLWQNKGWDISDPAKTAVEVTKAYREAERFIGVPPSELIRMPKSGDEAAAKAMWQRLGAPPDAAGYDFAGVKFADGTDVDADFATHMRNTFAALNVPKDAAVAIAQNVIKFMENAETTERTEASAKLVAEQAALAKNWGANAEANRFVAKQAAAALKVTPEELDVLEKQIGGARVMEMFRSIGERMGEGKFVANGAPGGTGVMTREQAVARRTELMRDSTWSKKYLDGDVAANRELQGLLTLIHGDDTDGSRSY